VRKISYIFLGALIGIALTIGGSAFAASAGLLGQKITGQVPIIYNGEQISASGYVADGTTLLPVRSIASILGINAEYKDGTVYLTKEGDSGVTETPTPTDSTSGQDQTGAQVLQLTAEQIQKQLDDVNHDLPLAENAYKSAQEVYDAFKNDPKSADQLPLFEKALETSKAGLEKLQKEKADLEAQLKALQGQ